MAVAEELIVAIRSEGVGETQEDLDGVEESMEQTAESAGDSADELEGFSERFAGAMSAAVAALAVGAAGLLAQVPVLGEAFAGLAAIVEALAFQVDGILRPALAPLTDLFFELSAAIFEADGATGDIIGGVTALLSILGIAVPTIAAIGSTLGVWASTAAGVVSILGTLAGVVGTVAGAIAGLPVALVAAVAALTAFTVAYLTNWRGVRDKTDAIVGEIVDFVVSGFRRLGTRALGAIIGFAFDVREELDDLAADLSAWASDLAGDAREWGANLIERFIGGIKTAIGRLRDFLADLRDIGANVGIDVPDLGGLGGGGGGGGTAGAVGGRGRRATFAGTGGTQVDGRQLAESTGRYRSDPNRRRGI